MNDGGFSAMARPESSFTAVRSVADILPTIRRKLADLQPTPGPGASESVRNLN